MRNFHLYGFAECLRWPASSPVLQQPVDIVDRGGQPRLMNVILDREEEGDGVLPGPV